MEQLTKVNTLCLGQGLDVPTLLESFSNSLDVRENTKQAYHKGLARFMAWLADNSMTQPDRETILRFKGFLKDSGHTPSTINNYLVAVKRFFAYLESTLQYPDIAKDIQGYKQPFGHLRDALTLPQLQNLLSSIATTTLQGKRDFAFINLLARTGLRTIEIIRADVGDLKQEAGEALLYVQGKGRDSKDAFVVLTEEALGPILAYLSARGRVEAGDALFASLSDRNHGRRLTTKTIRQIVKHYLKLININNPKLTAHSLRHTFATWSLRAGAPLIQVRDALRHSSIETTQRYLHNLERIDNAAERYIGKIIDHGGHNQ